MAKYIKIGDFETFMPHRPQNSNKGTFGKVLNIAGCKNYIGAAFLSSLSPLKTGAGLVTLASTSFVISFAATKISEITFLHLPQNNDGAICSMTNELKNAVQSYDVISVGCGLGIHQDTKEFIQKLFEIETKAKWVIDADALNIISALNIEKLPFNSLLTPHPKELSRLLKIDVEEINRCREKYAVLCAKNFGATVLLKGQNTIVTNEEERVYVNETGNSSLAKAGSGDVLTGIISGLIAQGCSVFESAAKGAYLHGLAGELASKELSEYSVLATDQINFIPKAILTIFNK